MEKLFRQFTLEELWTPPGEGKGHPRLSGCGLLDAFTFALRYGGREDPRYLATRIGLRRELLSPAIEALTGMRAREWIEEWIMRDARWWLLHSTLSVTEIGRKLGFEPVGNFTNMFKRREGCTPRHYRTKYSTVKSQTHTERALRPGLHPPEHIRRRGRK